MMYGDEKRRHMARSILPSTSRVHARAEKKRKNKKVRRSVKVDLKRYDDSCEEVDLLREPFWGWYLSDRRAADKVAHFEKWAVKITEDLDDPSSRLSRMRGILPKGLIGQHAISHLVFLDEFRTNPFHGNSSYNPLPPEKKLDYPKLLAEIIQIGALRKFNAYLKQCHVTVVWGGETVSGFGSIVSSGPTELVGPTSPRLLLGVADIEPFLLELRRAKARRGVTVQEYVVREVRRSGYRKTHTYIWEFPKLTRTNPKNHPEWEKAMKEFVHAWVATEGNLEAVCRKLNLRA